MLRGRAGRLQLRGSRAAFTQMNAAKTDDDRAPNVAPKMQSEALLVSGLSTAPELGDALTEALRLAAGQLPEGVAPTSCVLLVSSRYCNFGDEILAADGRTRKSEAYDKVAPLVGRLFAQRGWAQTPVVGCSISAALSQDQEPESVAGVSITLGYLPGVTCHGFRVPDAFDEDWTEARWREACGLPEESPGAMLLLAHPDSPSFTDTLLGALDFAFPKAGKFGAVAAKAEPMHEPALFLIPSLDQAQGTSSPTLYDDGVVGLSLCGDVTADAVVAQGARPIGPNYEIVETDCNGTVVTRMREVGTEMTAEGAPMTLFDMAGFTGAIDLDDVKAALEFLALGVSLNPLEDDPSKHQYIVRPITDLQKDGPVALNEGVRPGQVVRFQVRDAGNATQELHSLMERWTLEKTARAEFDGKLPAGALLFSDAARGRQLYGEDGVETSTFSKTFKGVPLGGAFVSAVIGQLPNFKMPHTSVQANENISSLVLNMGSRTYVHSVGSAFFMLYGNSTAASK